jgi:DNA (cytosine-5)-methyltransferase 1
MTLGSLFSGRGGFEIGAAACGIQTLWTCETDEFLHHKLKRVVENEQTHHYRDARTLSHPPKVDIISAGFPCQDISCANTKNDKGIFGSRSGLWREAVRISDEVKPSYLVLENSPNLLNRGFEYVLRDLSAIGYNAEWDCWRAADFGYPHNRLRLYIVAYARSLRWRKESLLLQPPKTFELSREWTPTETYLRVLHGRADQCGRPDAILRGDVVPNFGREIRAFGNAVMPVVAEHLFKCIIRFDNQLKTDS